MVLNYLYAAMKLYPDSEWNYTMLSDDPTIPFSLIMELHNKDWCWPSVSTRKDINLDFVVANPNLLWNMQDISHNKSIPISDIIKNCRCSTPLNWSWDDVSVRHDVTLQIVNDNSDLPWNWMFISTHQLKCERDLTIYRNVRWDVEALFHNMHTKINLDTVITTSSYIPWEVEDVSAYCNFTTSQFETHIDYAWDIATLSENKCLTLELYMKHYDKFKDNSIPHNVGICARTSIDQLYQYRYVLGKYGISWFSLSLNISISIDAKIDNLLGPQPLPWSKIGLMYIVNTSRSIEYFGAEYINWQNMYINFRNLDPALIIQYKHQDWNWIDIHENKKITWQHVIQLQDKALDWGILHLIIPGLNINILLQLQSKPLNWNHISFKQKYVSFYDIAANPILPWTRFVIYRKDIDLEQAKTLPVFNELTRFLLCSSKLQVESLMHHKKWNTELIDKVKYRNHIRVRYIDRTMKRWRQRTLINKAHRMNLYSHVLDVFKLRVRDFAVGVRKSLS